MTGYIFTTRIDAHWVHEVEDALGYIERRLLGRVPHAITVLCTEATNAFWDAAAASGDVIRLAGAHGHVLPAIAAATAAEDRTPERLAAEHAAAEAYEAWQGSPEAAREEAFWEFEQTRRAETEQLYRAWLDDQAAEFLRARGRWRTERRAALRDEFGALEGDPLRR